MTKKVQLIVYLQNLGFVIEFLHDKIVCRHAKNIIVLKRNQLSKRIYQGVKYQLDAQGYNVSDYDENFLTKRQKKVEPFEIQYDNKPWGAVIRVNTAKGCVLRICGIPKELVFNADGSSKDFVDITISNALSVK
jgi:hypothetical protein